MLFGRSIRSPGCAAVAARLETLKRHWPLLALVVTAALAYSLYSLLRHWHFGSGGHDLGIVDQVIWHYSRFETPATTIRFEPTPNVLGDHFSPIVAVLAPLYWLFPGAGTLLVAQGVLFALSIVPVFLFTRKRLGPLPGYCFAAAYALFWGIQNAVAFDFHEAAFAVPLTAFAIYFMDGRRWASYFACIALLLLVKEDTGILVAFFGLCLLIQKQLKPGIASVLAGTIWFILVIEVFIPSCDPPDSEFGYWAYYGQFGTDFTGIVKNMLRDPLAVLQALVDPRQKLQTLFATFGPFALLAFLSPLVVLTIPVFLERFLASNSLMWGQQFHYTATLSPIIAMASADSLHRLAGWAGPGRARYVVAGVSILVLALNVGLLPLYPLSSLVKPGFCRQEDYYASGRGAIQCIPRDASVVAQDGIIPHLSQREEIFLLRGDPPETDYVIVCENISPWPNDSYEDIERYLAQRAERGYTTIFSENGWVVMERPVSSSRTASSRHW